MIGILNTNKYNNTALKFVKDVNLNLEINTNKDKTKITDIIWFMGNKEE